METLFGGDMKLGDYLGVIGCVSYSFIIVGGIIFCMKNYLKAD
jgi:hypothetical protein